MREATLRVGRGYALALLLLFTPAARAETTEPGTPHYGPRLRFGVGLISGGTLIGNLEFYNGIAALFGLDLRLGIQLNDQFAVMYQGGATLLWPWLGNAVVVEVTPIEYVSVAVGGGVYWFAVGGEADLASSLSVGIPIRVAFNAPTGTSSGGQRHAISFSATIIPASTVGGTYTTGLQLGLMGGISFELY